MLTIPKGQQWSKYQLDIFRHFQEMKKGDTLVIDAAAGSGKSSTIVALAQLLNGEKGLFVAFNKSIATELGDRLKGTQMKASTVHAQGMSALRYYWRNEYGNPEVVVDAEGEKYRRFILKFLEPHKERIVEYATKIEEDGNQLWLNAIRDFARIVDLVRLNLVDPTDLVAINNLCNHHGMMPLFFQIIGAGIAPAIQYGEALARDRTKVEIDFTDMIYLPNKWNLTLYRYNNVFIDEAQDLNPAQRGIVFKVSSRYGRTVYVGDPEQAINGWSGADAESFTFIKRFTKAIVLPLSICYRCPNKVIELAKILVPTIEARPDAPDGEVLFEVPENLPELVRDGDVIVGRKTADLVAWCLRLIVAGRSATVLGTDIGEGMINVLTTIKGMRKHFVYDEMELYVNEWEALQINRLRAMGADEPVITAISDKCNALRICIQLIVATDFDGLVAGIRDLFSDKQSPIVFMTIHKAKGLEADRVFILSPDDLPLRWSGQLGWQATQESNLLYVAITRAKQSLIFLGDLPAILRIKQELQEDEVVQVTAPIQIDETDTDWPAAAYVAPVSVVRIEPVRTTTFAWRDLVDVDTDWPAKPLKRKQSFRDRINDDRRKRGQPGITILGQPAPTKESA